MAARSRSPAWRGTKATRGPHGSQAPAGPSRPQRRHSSEYVTSERPPESAGGSQRSLSASGERLRLYCRSRGADGGPGAAQRAGAVSGRVALRGTAARGSEGMRRGAWGPAGGRDGLRGQ